MKLEEVEAKKKELRETLAMWLWSAVLNATPPMRSQWDKLSPNLKEQWCKNADNLINVLAPIIGIVDWEAPKLTRADYYTEKDSPHYELAGWHPAYRID